MQCGCVWYVDVYGVQCECVWECAVLVCVAWVCAVWGVCRFSLSVSYTLHAVSENERLT